MACRFPETNVRTMGRAARGVTGIKFKLEDDCVVSMEIVPSPVPLMEEVEIPEGEEDTSVTDETAPEVEETEDAAVDNAGDETEELVDDGRPQLLVVTSGGMGKRSFVESYRLTKRGAKGVKNVNLAPGETVVAAIRVSHGDEILMTTERGQVVRTRVDEIRLVGRNSKGVRIMNLRKGDRITSVSRLVEVEAQEAKDITADQLVATAGTGSDPEYKGEDYELPETAETEAVAEENAAAGETGDAPAGE